MHSKDSIKNLLKQNLIKKCPVDRNAISNLLKRAHKDIDTSRRNIKFDIECAFNYSYNAMLHCGLALMNSEGYRPDIKGKHATIIRFVSAVMGDKYKIIINTYDYMRRKRHHFLYEPGEPCSEKEAYDAISTAKKFLNEVKYLINKKYPDLELDS